MAKKKKMTVLEQLVFARSLIGRYLIRCKGSHTKNYLYMRDRLRSDEGYWTEHLEEAVIFHSLPVAIAQVDRLQYNDPEVVVINDDGSFTQVYPEVKAA